MKVISGLGGSGTTFVLDALRRHGSKVLFGGFDTYDLKSRLHLSPGLNRKLRRVLSWTGMHVSNLNVLKRPDTFWTDWAFNPSGSYAPEDPAFSAQVVAQRDYLLQTAKYRSEGLPIKRSDLSADSLTELVASYLARLEAIERELGEKIVLVCGHWGEYGILRELGVQTIYLIRDPFNSVVSHSKPTRHQADYLRRGLKTLNSREWIEAYLAGPHHYWIRHAEHALSHANATIIRYQHFPTDWQQVVDLPDIGAEFEYRENNVAEILAPALIDYIYARTDEICRALGFDEIYRRIREAPGVSQVGRRNEEPDSNNASR